MAIGGVFIAYFGFLILQRGWKLRREVGLTEAIKDLAKREGIAVLMVGLLAGLDADPDRAGQLRRLFPVGCLTFLGLVVTSAIAS